VLEPALVQRYERLRAAPPNRGVAAARVGDGFCLGCRATLPTAFAQSLESQPTGAVVACPRCGRLLVLGP
jgi:predicted  nucleic acid-binding Zn-ribbon protein